MFLPAQTNPGLALELQILQAAESMDRAVFKNNAELIAIPAGAENHSGWSKIQQLIRPRCIEEAAILERSTFLRFSSAFSGRPGCDR